MEVSSKRIDHLGIVAGTIERLGIIKIVDELLGVDDQYEVTSGEAVAAMIMNGLGFANRSIMLTPQFYATKALDELLRPGVKAEYLNRFKLGRTLDKVVEYGCEKLFTTLAMHACAKENVGRSVLSSDTTSIALSGKYDECSDLEEVFVKHGYSKDHRPDLKQIIAELTVTQDGGVPIMHSIWSGNTSDVKVLRERVRKLSELFMNELDTPCLVGDSKLYTSESIRQLSKIKFVTRVPATIKREQEIIDQAIIEDGWQTIDENYKFAEYEISHYGINQRWVVVHSEHAAKRSKQGVEKAARKELETCKKALFHLQAKRFSCEKDAIKELQNINKKLKLHVVSDYSIIQHAKHEGRGRPSQAATSFEYQISATAERYHDAVRQRVAHSSCFVLATNLNRSEHPAPKVVEAYKKQDLVEKSFAFIKNPSFFASSLFLKNQQRLQGLLTVMMLALLVYSLAQRYIRKQLSLFKLTIPNQIKKPSSTPTLNWIFQLMEGVSYISVKIDGVVHKHIDGATDIRRFIIKLFSPEVQQIYKFF
jgi:transposase